MKQARRFSSLAILAKWLLPFVVFLSLLFYLPPTLLASAQQPTGSIPTVTGTPEGPRVIVFADQDIIGVFAGPSASIQVGILLAGEEAPALGYSLDGEWIQIIYLGAPEGKGWIYAPFVGIIKASELPVLPNPATATPRTTPTIDPTRAAEYGYLVTQVRLTTFTQPPDVEIPVYESDTTGLGFPVGMIILGLFLIGALGAIFSFLRGR